MKLIGHLKELLANEGMRYDVIKRVTGNKDKFGDGRRTEITYLDDERYVSKT